MIIFQTEQSSVGHSGSNMLLYLTTRWTDCVRKWETAADIDISARGLLTYPLVPELSKLLSQKVKKERSRLASNMALMEETAETFGEDNV